MPAVIPELLAARIRDAAKETPGGLAVFDADGTLWREDVGEAFLRHLVSLGWVQLPDGSDPYEAYERAVDRDRASGYAYAAQLQAGLLVEKVEAEARLFAASWVPGRRIASAGRLRDLCESAGLRTAVVSASALPIVIAAAPLAGFGPAQCHGIEVRTRSGRFTAEVIQPITYAEGKIEAVRNRGAIVVACGDSLAGDLAMLQAAQIAVVVAPDSGSPLADEGRRRGWAVLDQGS
jgi:phosphoserine phosphatase